MAWQLGFCSVQQRMVLQIVKSNAFKCWTLDIGPQSEFLIRVFWDTKSLVPFFVETYQLSADCRSGSSALAVLATLAGLSGRIWHIWIRIFTMTLRYMKRWTMTLKYIEMYWAVLVDDLVDCLCYLCHIHCIHETIVRSIDLVLPRPEWRTGTVQRFACRDSGGATFWSGLTQKRSEIPEHTCIFTRDILKPLKPV